MLVARIRAELVSPARPAAGLIVILVAMVWPEYWMALWRFHLHINLLGFRRDDAFGTLCCWFHVPDMLTPMRGRHGDLYLQ
jgi:hypothetical protein